MCKYISSFVSFLSARVVNSLSDSRLLITYFLLLKYKKGERNTDIMTICYLVCTEENNTFPFFLWIGFKIDQRIDSVHSKSDQTAMDLPSLTSTLLLIADFGKMWMAQRDI
jgi:hypothetical protein